MEILGNISVEDLDGEDKLGQQMANFSLVNNIFGSIDAFYLSASDINSLRFLPNRH